MVFVADDLGAWLVALLSERGRRRLTTLVLGSDQERALIQAAAAAVRLTAGQLCPDGDGQADHLAMVISEVFSPPRPDASLHGQTTLLVAMHEAVTGQLAVLNDPDLTGTEQSSAAALGIPASVLAQSLTGHLLDEIVTRGSRGGPLFPLASQLNDDMTHLQGQQIQGELRQLGNEILSALARKDGVRSNVAPTTGLVWLPPRSRLVGREDLLAELHACLTATGAHKPHVVALYGLAGVGRTSVAIEYAHRHRETAGLAWQLSADNDAVLAAEFARLAAALGVAGGILHERDPVASVHAALAASPTPWLLIFDNVARPGIGPGILAFCREWQSADH